MPALAPAVGTKIAKLIPRLGTEHDGEVIATARAIVRTLRSVGLDLHTLAKIIEHEPAPPEVQIVYREPASHAGEPETWRQVARWCVDNDQGRLARHERGFCWDLAYRLVCGGEPTEKQAAWLRAIYAKLRKEPDA